ncbi:MAG: endonuclease/exonuclease/phosphatase family protein [Desulfobulbaceae bacterium]|nr:endonuclease/exonuclease/phosphatase family protein [Desulfobulbaceae bacterium]
MKEKEISRKLVMASLLCVLLSLIAILPTALLADNAPRGWITNDFSVMSWNVCFKSDYHAQAALDITNLHANIVGVQEDFSKFFYNSVSGYNFKLQPTSATGIKIMGNGLSVFSDTLISDSRKVAWNICFGDLLAEVDCLTTECHDCDCLGDKGFTFSKIQMSLGDNTTFFIHFYNLHTDAGRPDVDALVRFQQLVQLRNFMGANSVGMPVIVVGDFNLQGMPGMESEIATMSTFMSYPETGLTMANHEYEKTTNSGSKFDYVLYRPGTNPNISLDKISCRVMNEIGGSDHLPIWTNFRYTVNYDAFPDLTVTGLQLERMSEGIWNAYVTIKNLGPNATPAGTPVRVNVQIQGDKTVTAFNHTPALASGQSYTIDIGIENCYPPYGTFTGIASVDSLEEIQENNEFNNVLQQSFGNGSKPEKPTLLTPVNNFETCSTTLGFTWKWDNKAYPAVDYYQLQINNANGTKLHVSPNRKVANYTVPAGILQNGKSYAWYVRAHNALGWSKWSSERIVYIMPLAKPGLPSLIYPSGGSTISSPTPTLKWSGVVACPAVDYYDVQLNTVDGSDGWVFEHIAGTTYKVPNYYLVSGQTYEWFVRAHNAQGWGAWSARKTFRVQLP